MQLNPVLNQFFYNPVGLSLNYEQVSRLANPTWLRESGVFGMQFRDHDELKGDYTVLHTGREDPDRWPAHHAASLCSGRDCAQQTLYDTSNRNASYQTSSCNRTPRNPSYSPQKTPGKNIGVSGKRGRVLRLRMKQAD